MNLCFFFGNLEHVLVFSKYVPSYIFTMSFAWSERKGCFIFIVFWVWWNGLVYFSFTHFRRPFLTEERRRLLLNRANALTTAKGKKKILLLSLMRAMEKWVPVFGRRSSECLHPRQLANLLKKNGKTRLIYIQVLGFAFVPYLSRIQYLNWMQSFCWLQYFQKYIRITLMTI